MSNEITFRNVVSILGSQARLAKLLGKRPSTVAYWATTGIPAEDAVELEKATNGEVPRWVSRPDLWDAPAEAAQ